jgi:hypothetical protein
MLRTEFDLFDRYPRHREPRQIVADNSLKRHSFPGIDRLVGIMKSGMCFGKRWLPALYCRLFRGDA